MTPEAQRIAIAKACGTMSRKAITEVLLGGGGNARFVGWGEYNGPDYLSNLNAMHEAEKVLWTGGNAKNQIALYNSLLSSWNGGWEFHATAFQRAEAFLRTLNLWKDE